MTTSDTQVMGDRAFSLPLGAVLAGTYRITDVLSHGGRYASYLAEHVTNRTLHVIEQVNSMTPHESDGPASLDRFVRQAEALAEVRHPNIAAVCDIYREHDRAYMVLEYEQGRSLRSWIDGLDSPITQLELDLIAGPLLDGLSALHASGHIHGDLEPQNIRIRYDGRPVLYKFLGDYAQFRPGYSPPEQYGPSAAHSGPWTDLYMLGALLYEMTSGNTPHEAVERLIEDRLPSAAHAAKAHYRPATLWAIDHALRLSPRERPQSAVALRDEFFSERVEQTSVQPQAQARPTEAAKELALTWEEPHGMYGLSLVNFLLRIPTLGLYSFWGRTEVRKRIWSSVRLDGEPLEYTGTGKELMIGFLVIFAALLLPYLLVSVAVVMIWGETALQPFQLASYALFALLYGIGYYRATRYRLSRTRWRGIRGSLVGSSWSYGWTAWWTLPFLVLTLGWLSPWRSTLLQRMLVEDMRFGDRPFRFTATSSGLYRRYAATWVGTIIIAGLTFAAIFFTTKTLIGMTPPTRLSEETKGALGFAILAILGVAYILYTVANAWYRTGMLNHFANHTHIDNATFKSTATVRGVLFVTVTNALMTIFSLGLLTPVAQARWGRYLVEHLSLEGTLSSAAIAQATKLNAKGGEGLAQAFDLDAF